MMMQEIDWNLLFEYWFIPFMFVGIIIVSFIVYRSFKTSVGAQALGLVLLLLGLSVAFWGAALYFVLAIAPGIYAPIADAMTRDNVGIFLLGIIIFVAVASFLVYNSLLTRRLLVRSG